MSTHLPKIQRQHPMHRYAVAIADSLYHGSSHKAPIRHPNANNPKLQKQAGMPTSQHLMNPENAKYSMSMLMLLILTIQEGFPFCPFLLSNCILTFSEAGSYPYESSSDTTNCKSVETTKSAPIRMYNMPYSTFYLENFII